MNSILSLLIALTLPLLASALMAVPQHKGWSAQGAWDVSNLTDIDTIIHNTNKAVIFGSISASNIALKISTELQALWQPAWNVLYAELNDPHLHAGIVYGHAFRDHWLWINGYRGTSATYIIWKD